MEKITETTLENPGCFLFHPQNTHTSCCSVHFCSGWRGEQPYLLPRLWPGSFSSFGSATSDSRKNKSSGEKAEPPGIHQTTAATCVRKERDCPGRQRTAPGPSVLQHHNHTFKHRSRRLQRAPGCRGRLPGAAVLRTSSPAERPSPRLLRLRCLHATAWLRGGGPWAE